jgi:hypothetical protein
MRSSNKLYTDPQHHVFLEQDARNRQKSIDKRSGNDLSSPLFFKDVWGAHNYDKFSHKAIDPLVSIPVKGGMTQHRKKLFCVCF